MCDADAGGPGGGGKYEWMLGLIWAATVVTGSRQSVTRAWYANYLYSGDLVREMGCPVFKPEYRGRIHTLVILVRSVDY